MTLLKGLKHVGLPISIGASYGLAALFGLLTMGIGAVMVGRIHLDPAADRAFHFANVEKVFAVLMIFTACSMAFAHGSNDVANAIGPVAAIVGVIQSGGDVAQKSTLPLSIILIGAVGMVAGLGHVRTEGDGDRGFGNNRAHPQPRVHRRTGRSRHRGARFQHRPAHLHYTYARRCRSRVGIAGGIAAINLRTVRTIFISWIVTLPAGAILRRALLLHSENAPWVTR